MSTFLRGALAVAMLWTATPAMASGFGCGSCRTVVSYPVSYPVQHHVVQKVVEAKPAITNTTTNDHRITITNQFNFSQPASEQGATSYGYADILPNYGSLDIGATLNLAAKLTQNAQQLAGQALADYSDVTSKSLNAVAEIAKIEATKQAAVAALQAAGASGNNAGGASVRRTFSFHARIEPNGRMVVEPAFNAEPLAPQPVPGVDAEGELVLQQVVQTKCLECHAGGNAKGGLDLGDLGKISAESMKKILARISTTDQEKRMPKAQPALTVDEMAPFFQRLHELSRTGKK